MRSELLQIQHLRASSRQRFQQAALAAACGAADNFERQALRYSFQQAVHGAPVFFVATIELHSVPAYLGQNMRHCAAAVAATPAIDQRFPVARLVMKMGEQGIRNILRDQRCAAPFGIEGAGLLVERADLDALVIVQNRAVNRTRNMVERELGFGAHVNDAVVGIELRKHLIGGQQCRIFHCLLS